MNFLKIGILPLSLALAACETINRPVSTGTFDPLTPPGSVKQDTTEAFDSGLTPGEFVTANVPNTAFYNKKPSSSQDADKLLDQGTQMKIVAVESNMVKVELDSGDVGYVPTVMVSGAGATAGQELYPVDGTYQVYPPIPGGPMEPLPVIDLEGLPPEGAIPTIIDPDAPAEIPAPPSLDAIPEPMPTPTTPDSVAAEEELDPVAEAVRLKVEAAMKEDEAKKAAAEVPAAAE
ncbi:hypothetical protein [Luteolibacter sp. AS25]|uniref:hypothetical protein n=1 Tax=Luteolibacter sp. AS25 TaxID=3135776 RepID=UPI00398A7995